MGSQCSRPVQTWMKGDSRPWLTHPDGKWSPRPRLPSDSRVSYEVDGYCLDAELDQKSRWKSQRSAFLAGQPLEFSLEFLAPAEIKVVGAHGQHFASEFDIHMVGVAGFGDWQGMRSKEDFERMHKDLQSECSWTELPPLPFRTNVNLPQFSPILSRCQSEWTSSELQVWLKMVIDSGLATSQAFRSFSGLSCPPCKASSSQDEALSLLVLDTPILNEIAEFLDCPKDFARISAMVSKSTHDAHAVISGRHWERMYKQRWPAFFDAQNYRPESVDWKSAYQQMLSGKFECILEVYERERKMGFAMSCMTAKVSYNNRARSFTANYISASYVLPEQIPVIETQRLRFCPVSARTQLRPQLHLSDPTDLYSNRILEGIEDIQVGRGVELQWKMQVGSPFGWWFGEVESIEHRSPSKTAMVTMVFHHFPMSSRWYRLTVTVGDGELRDCAIGGYHGGMRACSEAERKDWMCFFPKKPVVF